MEKIKKDDLIKIINNLNLEEIKKEVLKLAFYYLNNKKPVYRIIVLLSTINGNIEYKIEPIDNLVDYIVITNYDLKAYYLDYEAEDILDEDPLNEYLSIIEDEESEFFEEEEYALEYILDKYELDKDELVMQHFIKSNLDNVKTLDKEDIIEKL